jgi:hypothetical protein
VEHVGRRRVEDAIDQGGEAFERALLFGKERVSIVYLADARNRVRQRALGVIGGHPGAAH